MSRNGLLAVSIVVNGVVTCVFCYAVFWLKASAWWFVLMFLFYDKVTFEKV